MRRLVVSLTINTSVESTKVEEMKGTMGSFEVNQARYFDHCGYLPCYEHPKGRTLGKDTFP